MNSDFPKRVLIVEDDPMVRRLLVRHFEKGGAAIDQAANAEEALSTFVNGRVFDVVVTDIHLPGRTGLDLATELRVHVPQQPIVFVTGDVDEKLARRALAAGKAGYLLKPFEFFELDAAVAQAIQAAVPVSDTFHPGVEGSEERWLAQQRVLLIAASKQAVDVGTLGRVTYRPRFEIGRSLKIWLTVLVLVITAAIIGYAITSDPAEQPPVVTAPESNHGQTIYYVPQEPTERRRTEPTR